MKTNCESNQNEIKNDIRKLVHDLRSYLTAAYLLIDERKDGESVSDPWEENWEMMEEILQCMDQTINEAQAKQMNGIQE